MRQAGLIATALVATLAVAPAAEAADVYPECAEMEWVKSGTFKAELTSIGLIIGARWGDGTVNLEDGRTFNFKMSGGSILDIGGSATEFEGTVYNLGDLKDFEGTYSGVSTGAAVVKGIGGISLTNSNCVALNAEVGKTGLQLKAGPEGVKVSLEE